MRPSGTTGDEALALVTTSGARVPSSDASATIGASAGVASGATAGVTAGATTGATAGATTGATTGATAAALDDVGFHFALSMTLPVKPTSSMTNGSRSSASLRWARRNVSLP